MLKRVIGLPGDEIFISGGIVHLNGVPIPKSEPALPVADERISTETLGGVTYRILESTIAPKDGETTSEMAGEADMVWPDWPPGYAQNGIPHRVGKDAVFVLGDHRDNSIDSRIWGDVPLNLVTGRVE